MVAWREQGFVQDSDEDGDISDSSCEQQRQDTAPVDGVAVVVKPSQKDHDGEDVLHRLESGVSANPNNDATHAASLPATPAAQDTALIDLQDFEDIDKSQRDTARHNNDDSLDPAASVKDDYSLKTSTKEDLHAELGSIDSSPLSQPPDDLPLFEPLEVNNLQQSSTSVRTSNPVTLIQNAQDDEVRRTERNFRQRNPIQLHPYLLENEQYRQSLRARGLRPVAVTNEERRHAAETQAGETQYQVGTNAEESQSTAFGLSSQSTPSSSPLLSSRQHRTTWQDESDGDELPTLADILANTIHHDGPRRHKRRKLTPAVDLSVAGQQEEIFNLFDVPQSPKTIEELHRSSIKKRRLNKFRVPKGFEAAPLPTPLASSDALKPPIELIHINSESENEPDPASDAALPDSNHLDSPHPSQRTRVRSSSPGASEPSLSESDQIQKASKRIKGVLPASWLRLDQQGQRRKPVPPSRLPLPKTTIPESGPQKGVAQRIPSSARPDKRAITIDVLDDSGSSDDDLSNRNAALPPQEKPENSIEFVHSWTLETQDMEEDDFVDPMLPSAERRRTSKPDKKRQLRLTDTLERVQQKSRPSHPYPRDLNPRPRTQRARTKGYPRYSIVDAVRSMPRTSTPDFVRLAVRQAKSRPNKGRHSPSRKILSLHIREDDLETQRGLTRWKKGRISHWKEYGAVSYRAPPPLNRKPLLPLSERSYNQQARLPSPQRLVSAGKDTTSSEQSPSLLGKSRGVAAKENHRQSRLNPVSLSKDTDVASVRGHSLPKTAHQGNAVPRPEETRGSWNRPGHLENLQAVDDEEHRESAFRRNLLNLDDGLDQRRSHYQRISNPLIERYFAVDSQDDLDSTSKEVNDPSTIGVLPKSLAARRERKRRPKPLPTNNQSLIRLGLEDQFLNETQILTVDEQTPKTLSRLRGLGPFGTKYTTDFNVKSLPIGAYFHNSTFLGSGEFDRALSTTKRDFSIATSSMALNVKGATLSVGPWTEETAEHLEKVFAHVIESFNSSLNAKGDDVTRLTLFNQALSDISSALRAVVAYFASVLHFLDSIDRASFSQRISEMMANLVENITAATNSISPDTTGSKVAPLTIRTLSLMLTCGFQNTKIASHPIVDLTQRAAVEQMFRKLSTMLAEILVDHGVPSIQDGLEQLQKQETRELGLRDDNADMEGLVILAQVLKHAKLPGFGVWDLLNDALLRKDQSATDEVHEFEQIWSTIFHMLPVLEFDSVGTVNAAQRFTNCNANWGVVKMLLGRLFEQYSDSSYGHAASMNSYLRTVLTRCFNLVEYWGWSNCEPVLGVVFDFFAKRNFSLLHNEDSRGPPSFLEELDQNQAQTIQASDRSFDIFLKLLATGLKNMRMVYTPKKIKNIAWRFIPNHGRKHAKEHDLHEDDLDALRNHHNLLLVLYWASPPLYRINLDLIRNLVDFQTSHSEVCRLNVRTWANLVRFQLSTQEEPSAIDPFAAWMSSILTASMQQHEKARPEAEQVATRLAEDQSRMSRDLLESTIANNEKQVENVLSMALASMNTLLLNAQSFEAASRLFEKSSVSLVLQAFNPKHRRFADIISLAVDVYHSYFNILDKEHSKKVNQDSGEDSQDYGEWALLETVDDDNPAAPIAQSYDEAATESMQRLLSNVFGAEKFFNETLLTKVVDTWAYMCQIHVKRAKRDWSYYLDSQSPGSWAQLRDTEQTHKFAPYFLSAIVRSDKGAFVEHHGSILSYWLTSLVERESMLKYQHLLTAALLNTGSNHPLLSNLPFVRSRESHLCDISLGDLRARRILLLSTVLSNMRKGLEDLDRIEMTEISNRRQEFAALLKQLMRAMKKNYLETMPSSSTRGAYVDFVQKIVEFLQQYTADICPIDKFFTDSTAFPLPATDPTYVVGRLKNYSLQLANPGVQKKLATFFQAACERAVVDNQQSYLIGQLLKSVAGSFECSSVMQPSLRRFMLDALFPSYIESAFSTNCGWILALPILETTRQMFDELLYCFDVSDAATSASLEQTITVVYCSLRKATLPLLTDSTVLSQPQILSTVSAIFNTLTSALTVVDYIQRSGGNMLTAIEQVGYFVSLSRSLSDMNNHYSESRSGAYSGVLETEALRYSISATSSVVSSSFPEVSSFCKRELDDSLAKTWAKHDGRYFVLRGNARKEVLVETYALEDARTSLADALKEFKMMLDRLPSFDLLWSMT